PDWGQRLETLHARVRRSGVVTSALLIDVIAEVCARFAAHGYATKAAFTQLIADGAWTDAVLLLLRLELPQWKLRRIIYEDGEWHCFLSMQPQLPLELDEGVEAVHEALPLACTACCDNFA